MKKFHRGSGEVGGGRGSQVVSDSWGGPGEESFSFCQRS